MREERNESKKELLSKKELECKDLENSQPTHSVKTSTCSEGNITGVAHRPFIRRLVLMWTMDQISLPLKPGAEMGSSQPGPEEWRRAAHMCYFPGKGKDDNEGSF